MAKQVPIVGRLMRTIREKIDEFVETMSAGSNAGPTTTKLIDDIQTVIRDSVASKGIEGFTTAAKNLRVKKTEYLFQHKVFTTRDETIDKVADILENVVKNHRVEHIIDGVEIIDDVGKELGKEIVRSVSRMNAYEKLRHPISMEEILKPGLAPHLVKKPSSPVAHASAAVLASAGGKADDSVSAAAAASVAAVAVAVPPSGMKKISAAVLIKAADDIKPLEDIAAMPNIAKLTSSVDDGAGAVHAASSSGSGTGLGAVGGRGGGSSAVAASVVDPAYAKDVLPPGIRNIYKGDPQRLLMQMQRPIREKRPPPQYISHDWKKKPRWEDGSY
jgi:hypothetical protein